MKARRMLQILLCVVLAQSLPGFALSLPIGRDINFPPHYDPQKAKAIRQVIQDKRYKFVDGLVSYWPPDYGTRLSYEGNAKSLNEFLESLHKLSGISVRLVFYRGRNDELRRDSTWQLDFSQARPNELTVYLNLNAHEIEWDKVKTNGPPAK